MGDGSLPAIAALREIPTEEIARIATLTPQRRKALQFEALLDQLDRLREVGA